MILMNCPICGTPYPGKRNGYCAKCDTTAHRNIRICERCGHENPADAKYCLKCAKGFKYHSVMRATLPRIFCYYLTDQDYLDFSVFELKQHIPHCFVPTSILWLIPYFQILLSRITGKKLHDNRVSLDISWETITYSHESSVDEFSYEQVTKIADTGLAIYIYIKAGLCIVLPSEVFTSGDERLNVAKFLKEHLKEQPFNHYDYRLKKLD